MALNIEMNKTDSTYRPRLRCCRWSENPIRHLRLLLHSSRLYRGRGHLQGAKHRLRRFDKGMRENVS